ncbi:MAG: hypothetical protein ACO3S5_07720 [Ilumatobacteraceae bacterium]
MAITNGYCTLAELKPELRIPVLTDIDDDARLEVAIAAASRQIDAHCGRRFWQDSGVVQREFYANDYRRCEVDDISTTTSMVVQIDDDDDGTFETTLHINTDFILRPLNANHRVPVWPWEEIVLVDAINGNFPMSQSGRPGVRVTARFGWPAVPDDVKKACMVQSAMLFKSADAVFGVTEFANAGAAMRVGRTMNPIAAALLEPYCKPRVG